MHKTLEQEIIEIFEKKRNIDVLTITVKPDKKRKGIFFWTIEGRPNPNKMRA